MRGDSGFLLYLGAHLASVIYLLWAILPDRILESLGILWYPSRFVYLPFSHPLLNYMTDPLPIHREWSLLIPSFLTMSVVFVYIAYALVNRYETAQLDDLSAITDDLATLTAEPPMAAETFDIIEPIRDLPIGLVNRVLFSETADA
jgi:phosphatidylinositol glycan class P protein